MHDDPRPDAPATPDTGVPTTPATDPAADLTQRHAIPPIDSSTTPELAAPITPAPTFDRFSPTPEARPAWARSFDETPPVTPERWYEPAPTPAPTTPAVSGARTRSGSGSIVAASLLAAVLASGGTVLALGATGALDRQVTQLPSTSQASNAGTVQPVTIDESSATIAVAAKVSPAVVRISVTGASTSGNLNVIPETGVGSGVIFDSNGWILTNHHVVEGGEKFDVELKDGRKLAGSVYGIDTLTDLAIVKVEATGLPTASIGESDALKVGQLVIAIGSPLGTYSNSVTSGIVSAKGRSIVTDGNNQLTNLIQTDAAINPGNSGGPLLDANGNVIGINTAIASNSNGIGFAIPIDISRPIMAQAVAGEPLSRPYMGIHYVSITRQLAETDKLPVIVGALVGGTDQNGNPVRGVDAGTPAEKAGIKDDDIIVSVNGKVIDEEHPLDATLSQFKPGETVSVDLLRDGQHVTIQVTLGTRPAGL